MKLILQSTYIDSSAEILLTSYGRIRDWSASWKRFLGGKGNLFLKFKGREDGKFKVQYILCDFNHKCSIKFLEIDERNKGEIIVPNFDSTYSSLSVIVSVQKKYSDFSINDPSYPFSIEIETEKKDEDNPDLINEIIKKINLLKSKILELKKEIEELLNQKKAKKEIVFL